MKPKSPSPKKTDEEAREELQKPDMSAFDRAMRALIQVPHDRPKHRRQRKVKESG